MNTPPSPKRRDAVAYYRVSTHRQSASGLGLKAQEYSVRLYTASGHINLLREFTETESAGKNNRPVLKKALAYCRKHNALLIIAKLDRLGRNVAFISSLMESGVEFVAADNPEASQFILHIQAAFAQYEREQISQRTRLALQAAKRRGVELGRNGKALAEKNKKSSADFARRIKPVIDALRQEGFLTLQSMTDELNKRKIATYRKGSKWHKSRVHNLLKQIASLS